MKIVFASHTNINDSLVVGSHHLARNLAALGHEVLHLSSPLTALHTWKLRNTRYQERWQTWKAGGLQIENSLTDYVPFSIFPWQFARLFEVGPGNLFLKCLPSLESIFRRFDFEEVDLLLVDEPRMAGIERFCRAKKLIYRSTDLNAEFKKDPSILKAERWLIEQACGLIGTSEPVLKSLRSVAPNKPFILMENGADLAFFSALQEIPSEFQEIPEPRAIYVGAVDERFDFTSIDVLGRERPDLSIVIVGPVTVPNLVSGDNIYFLGSKPYATIPAYLQHSQIGLLPLNAHPANRGRSPMKLYEYAAAGLPVVATNSEEIARRQDSFVYAFEGSGEIAAAVQKALAEKGNAVNPADAAREHDWRRKAKTLLEFTSTTSCANGNS